MSLEQNALEDRDEIKTKFFVKIIKIIIKDNTATGQNALSSDQKTCFDLKQKRFGGFVRNLFILLKGQYGANILSLIPVLRIHTFYPTFPNGQCRSIHIVCDSNFFKTFETA